MDDFDIADDPPLPPRGLDWAAFGALNLRELKEPGATISTLTLCLICKQRCSSAQAAEHLRSMHEALFRERGLMCLEGAAVTLLRLWKNRPNNQP